MKLSSLITMCSFILIIISQNVVNSYNHHLRHHRQQLLQEPDCQKGQNCHLRRRSLPKTVELESIQFWNCDFDLNDCGIHNQNNMDSHFVHRRNNSEPVLGKKGLLYLDIANCDSSGARLITPYFPTNGCRYACLTIEYLMCGNSIKNLFLIQHDIRNYCVWQKDNDFTNRWTNSSITIDLSRSKPRFFIEAHFDRYLNNFGFIAISNMRFEYGSCHNNEANECNLNQYIGNFL